MCVYEMCILYIHDFTYMYYYIYKIVNMVILNFILININ